MPRHTLPSLHSESGGSLFFPSFQKEINRLIDQFRTGFPMPDTAEQPVFSTPLFPAVDIVDTDEAMEISAEVPGVRQEDLEATITGDILTLKGEKSSDHEESEDSFHRIERRYGSFRRQIPLGFSPEEDAVSASFANGVLKLRVAKPVTAKAEVRKIDISNG
ncbi:Hsp20/alpha crystallin family protein [Roseobacter sp. YSTF-M11]|uniref:Hsp20/alpha crystallin family protein n=1 Tax=Roseobacter insulae TaxID=2859783 RepID=A0A9X1FRK8_9RHOB|nr:Hsp20/alpha crystallin family protein [Roseobacter insulae]MBW4706297.1 Hsp20/alpha crystallin family protein [Roseobacter insulae]